MELIYRNIIMNKIMKSLCLFLTIILLCALSGCGMENRTEEESSLVEEGADKEESTETVQEEQLLTMSQLIKDMENSADDMGTTPDTVLWFNATYAPLTYSNSGNWRLVGGLRPTESNQQLVQYLLRRDWNISDKDSALETVERLKTEGHRAKCRECMEKLKEMGMLEMGEEEFLQALADSDIDEYIFRYIMAYYMYQEGQDFNCIAAWDLCRVNQLYADFYICGYMSYDEAMDASLENSLILQQMYSSWEEMVSSYMLGYQFWRSDPCITEDSPTLERYRNYEILLEMEDGPYTLDWDMELKKVGKS